MSGFRVILCIALVLELADSAAWAQRTGTRIGRDATANDGPAAMEILAQCAARRSPNLVRQWLNMLPGTDEETRLLQRWSNDLTACMDSDELVLDNKELVFQPGAMRLAVSRFIAQSLLRQEQSASLPAKTEVWFAAQLSAAPAGAKLDRSALVLQDFGYCVAQAEWAGTREFMLSQRGSEQQKNAIQKLVPVLGPCLQAGAQISLSPDNLRSALAEPVYHLLSTTSTASGSR